MDANKLKRSVLASGIAAILSFGSLVKVKEHSNIRNVDMVRILGCGATIGVFMTMVGITLFMKKKEQAGS